MLKPILFLTDPLYIFYEIESIFDDLIFDDGEFFLELFFSLLISRVHFIFLLIYM